MAMINPNFKIQDIFQYFFFISAADDNISIRNFGDILTVRNNDIEMSKLQSIIFLLKKSKIIHVQA